MGLKVGATVLLRVCLITLQHAAVPEVFAQSKLLLTCVYTLQPKFRLRMVLINYYVGF